MKNCLSKRSSYWDASPSSELGFPLELGQQITKLFLEDNQ